MGLFCIKIKNGNDEEVFYNLDDECIGRYW